MSNSSTQNDRSARFRERRCGRWTRSNARLSQHSWPFVTCYLFLLWLGIGCTDTLVEPLVRTEEPNGKPCAPPATACSGECYDLAISNVHCGACGVSCGGGSYCAAGSCVCPDGQSMCNGVCTSLESDPHNCGACDRSCDHDDTCWNGDCKESCDFPAKSCDGACVDVRSDKDHCGACFAECGNNQWCHDGKCDCDSPLVVCNDMCTDVDKDPKNCGECNKPCGFDQACVEGKCQ